MKERIKELEQQSMTFRAGIQMLDTDKFAELIVRECADIADNQEDYLTAKIIKEHFAVDGMSTEDKKTLIKELLGVKE